VHSRTHNCIPTAAPTSHTVPASGDVTGRSFTHSAIIHRPFENGPVLIRQLQSLHHSASDAGSAWAKMEALRTVTGSQSLTSSDKRKARSSSSTSSYSADEEEEGEGGDGSSSEDEADVCREDRKRRNKNAGSEHDRAGESVGSPGSTRATESNGGGLQYSRHYNSDYQHGNYDNN